MRYFTNFHVKLIFSIIIMSWLLNKRINVIWFNIIHNYENFLFILRSFEHRNDGRPVNREINLDD